MNVELEKEEKNVKYPNKKNLSKKVIIGIAILGAGIVLTGGHFIAKTFNDTTLSGDVQVNVTNTLPDNNDDDVIFSGDVQVNV